MQRTSTQCKYIAGSPGRSFHVTSEDEIVFGRPMLDTRARTLIPVSDPFAWSGTKTANASRNPQGNPHFHNLQAFVFLQPIEV